MLPDTQAPEQDEHEEYYRAYFGVDADYYLRKLEQYRAGTKITFNIGAFFFGIFWMLYRRMYKQGILVMIALTLESYLLGLAIEHFALSEGNAKLLNNLSTVLWSTAVGFLGNWLYLRQTQAKVTQALEEEESESDIRHRLAVEGSITYIPHIIIAALILLLMLVLQFNK
ncbi:DUF2628 domain-containing protein [Rufibacter sediminis]|uniref:DUF2628 domain-containing protein n=1 Tax=Rufibacter sediminis TaxID=2762756 RepID=A0ABR6VQS3_9BACT|nr:DUF2628 domain-containing protein [Rufibacter sediminis]MBC3539280.1 DUF2628 domain-containing protein [Rufibacter sediminis]